MKFLRFAPDRLLDRCCCRGYGRGTAPASAAVAPPPRASLTQFSCLRALDPDNRSVSVRAVMRPLAGTRKMAIKFDLLEQTAGSAPQALGQGRRPRRVDHAHRSDAGAAPRRRLAAEQARHQPRRAGRLPVPRDVPLDRSARPGARHRREVQPHVPSARAASGPARRSRSGRPPSPASRTRTSTPRSSPTRAPPEPVRSRSCSPPATPRRRSPTRSSSWPRIRARRLSFVGPVCDPANPPTVTVDAASQVDDYNRANNVMSAACPSHADPDAPARRRQACGASAFRERCTRLSATLH